MKGDPRVVVGDRVRLPRPHSARPLGREPGCHENGHPVSLVPLAWALPHPQTTPAQEVDQRPPALELSGTPLVAAT